MTHRKQPWDHVDSETVPPIEDELPPGAHRTPPAGYPTDRNQYAIPKWYALPVDTPEHARDAASRFPQMDIYNDLSAQDRRLIWRRIVEAERRFGIHPGKAILERAGLDET